MKKNTGAPSAMDELLSKSNETQIKDNSVEHTSTNTLPQKKAHRPQTVRTRSQATKPANGYKLTNVASPPLKKKPKAKKKMSLLSAIIAELRDQLRSFKGFRFRIPKAVIAASVAVIAAGALIAGIIFILPTITADKTYEPTISCGGTPVKASSDAVQLQLAPTNEIIRHNVTIDVFEGDSILCSTPSASVSQILEAVNPSVSESHVLRELPDAEVNADMSISYDKITYGTDTSTTAIPFETKTFNVQNIARGTTVVNKKGVNGVKTATYKVTYVNGVETERVLQGESVTKAPIAQVIHKGVGGTLNVGGKSYSYSHYIDCKTTVYTGGGITASGLPATENVIAVDPRVIPLGTQVYVEDAYCYVGFRTAADTGGVIKGNFIDIYFDESNPSLWGYGVRSARVYILD